MLRTVGVSLRAQQVSDQEILLHAKQENYFSVLSGGRDPVQSNQQNSGVPEKKEAQRIEFEQYSNSNSFVTCKMNFKSEVSSNSSFPTEAMVWINETDSARDINELNSSYSILGRMLQDSEVLDSKKMRVLPSSCWPLISRGESTW